MDGHMESKDLLPVEHYVKEILSGKCYHNTVPDEYENNLEIVHAEVAAGVRLFGNRGYDVIRNCFFVSQIVKLNYYKDEIRERERTVVFDSFDSYYHYLNGDIYNNAVYYSYVFSEEEKIKYSLDCSLFSKSAFIEDDLIKRSKEMDKEEERARKKLIRGRKRIIKWKNEFCQCDSILALESTARKYSENEFCDWDFVLSSFVNANLEKNLLLAIQFLANTDLKIDEKYLAMLCIKYQSLFHINVCSDCFDKYHWKRKEMILSIIQAMESGILRKRQKKGFNVNLGYFYITEQIFDPYANWLFFR